MTRFLKFEDEEQAREVLALYVIDGEWQTASHSHALDPVGIIINTAGDAIAGYHVNFIGDILGLGYYEVFPETPNRIFA